MRLLWLATSMKSFDVLVALLPTDEQNLAICDLVEHPNSNPNPNPHPSPYPNPHPSRSRSPTPISPQVEDMLPLLHSVHKHQRQPPQVLVSPMDGRTSAQP